MPRSWDRSNRRQGRDRTPSARPRTGRACTGSPAAAGQCLCSCGESKCYVTLSHQAGHTRLRLWSGGLPWIPSGTRLTASSTSAASAASSRSGCVIGTALSRRSVTSATSTAASCPKPGLPVLNPMRRCCASTLRHAGPASIAPGMHGMAPWNRWLMPCAAEGPWPTAGRGSRSVPQARLPRMAARA